jgi:hypothetical protein
VFDIWVVKLAKWWWITMWARLGRGWGWGGGGGLRGGKLAAALAAMGAA